jgi:hypothetical protein
VVSFSHCVVCSSSRLLIASVGSHEEEQIIQWFKDTTEVIRTHEEEQIIQWLKDTTEVIRSREEEQTIQWLKYTTEVIRSREEEQIIQYNETNVLTFLINCSMIPRNGTGFGPGIPNRLHKLCCHSE